MLGTPYGLRRVIELADELRKNKVELETVPRRPRRSRPGPDPGGAAPQLLPGHDQGAPHRGGRRQEDGLHPQLAHGQGDARAAAGRGAEARDRRRGVAARDAPGRQRDRRGQDRPRAAAQRAAPVRPPGPQAGVRLRLQAGRVPRAGAALDPAQQEGQGGPGRPGRRRRARGPGLRGPGPRGQGDGAHRVRAAHDARRDLGGAFAAGRGRRAHPEGQVRAGRGEPAPGGLDRQEIHQPGSAVPGPDPGGQHRPDEGGGEVRVPARLQVLDLRHLVDPAGHHARHRRPGPAPSASPCT